MREDQQSITAVVEKKVDGDWVAVPGLETLGTIIWENLTGGGGGSDSTKHRAGGMGDLESLGGPQTFENTTIERRFDGEVITTGLYLKLLSVRGRSRITITEQDLDEFGTPFGDPTNYQGKLVGVTKGAANANSGGVRMLSLECETVNIS